MGTDVPGECIQPGRERREINTAFVCEGGAGSSVLTGAGYMNAGQTLKHRDYNFLSWLCADDDPGCNV